MPRAPHAGDWLALAGLTVMWGSAFLFTELALAALAPSVIVAGRILVAAGFLSVLLVARGLRLPRDVRAWLPMAGVALFGNVVPFHLVTWGQQFIPSALAGVLMAMMPLFVLSLAHFLVPGARLTGFRVAGFVAGFLGVAIIIGPEALAGIQGNMSLLGALAVLGAAFSYAVSTIIARLSPAARPLVLAAGMLLIGSLVTTPLALAALPAPAALSLTAAAAMLFLGVLSTGYATVLYYRVVQGPGPAFLSLVNYLVPAWAVAAGALVLGESLPPAAYGGMLLILAGIALSEFGPRLIRSASNASPAPHQPVTRTVPETRHEP